MSELNANQRLLIQEEVSSTIYAVQRANDLLIAIWDDYFSMRDANKTSFFLDRDAIGNRIHAVTDLIFDALLEYGMKAGDPEIRGIEYRLDDAKQAMTAIEAERMIEEARSRMNAEDFQKTIRPLMDKPDAELIQTIRNVLQKVPA